MGNDTSSSVATQHVYPSGNVYTGEMKGNKRHGQGTLKWRDGAEYTGSWVNDECEGYGTMKFPNGSVFEGTWVRNNPHGTGKLTTVNQEVLNGMWEFHGRSDRTPVPVGKYLFSGELVDLKSGEQKLMQTVQLALYLTSGLVSLPSMPDPMHAMLPYAETVSATSATKVSKEDIYDSKQPLPIAQPVQNATSAPSSTISYGQQEPAFRPRHPDDHFAVSLLDPRVILSSLGVPVTPANINAQRQAEIRAMESQQHPNPY